MDFFSSDTHFGHFNILKYCNRPFKDVDEMDETIIRNWNKVVSKKDVVYHLGDFSFKDPFKYIDKLNGSIHLIMGNHDYKRINSKIKERFLSISDIKQINIQCVSIVLCHYAMKVWPKSHYNSWHLYGHSHGHIQNQGKSFDVGVDCNDFTPLSFEQVKEKMSLLQNNFNYVYKEMHVKTKINIS